MATQPPAQVGWNHANAATMQQEYERLLSQGVPADQAERIVRISLGGVAHDYAANMRSTNTWGSQDWDNPQSAVDQYRVWDQYYDANCPPDAPYQAEDGSGCVEKPADSNAGYQSAGAGGGGGGGGYGGGGGGRGGWGNGTAGAAPQFNYTPFEAPTYESAVSDPGYQFALKEGMNALQHSQAAQGLTRTGGSMRDLIDYGQQAGAQQYQNVYNRALSTWGAQYQGEKDAFAPQYGAWQTMYGGDLSRWTTNQNAALQKYLQREANIYGLLNPQMPAYG